MNSTNPVWSAVFENLYLERRRFFGYNTAFWFVVNIKHKDNTVFKSAVKQKYESRPQKIALGGWQNTILILIILSDKPEESTGNLENKFQLVQLYNLWN